MSDSVNLSGLDIPLDDIEREALEGEFSADALTQLFLSRWVAFFECDKCSRSDYCKFTKPSPYRAGRLSEIQCGVVEAAVKNYVKAVFPLVVDLAPHELQNWLDASFHLTRFILQAELHIGYMTDEYHVEWWGDDEHRAFFFGFTSRLRRDLDRFAGALQGIPAFATKSVVILTEGPSEKAFLERLKRSRLLWFTGLEVESYYGRGNRRKAKLTALANRLRKYGYDLFIQGDSDGSTNDIFEQLVRDGIVLKENTFAFQVDFESAFPPGHLYRALAALGMVDMTLEDFTSRVNSRSQPSVVGIIEGVSGTELDKVEFAEALADVLIEEPLWVREDDIFWQSEIGEFIDKIRILPG